MIGVGTTCHLKSRVWNLNSGEGEIRTREAHRLPVFETGALGHYATSPVRQFPIIAEDPRSVKCTLDLDRNPKRFLQFAWQIQWTCFHDRAAPTRHTVHGLRQWLLTGHMTSHTTGHQSRLRPRQVTGAS